MTGQVIVIRPEFATDAGGVNAGDEVFVNEEMRLAA
jgi:hypothetical protein